MKTHNGLMVGWLTVFIVGTDLFVVSPLLPLIAMDFGFSSAATGLSVTAFSVTYMVSAPILGGLADRTGRRRMLISCLIAFAAANFLTAWSPSFFWLLGARALAGVTAAGVTPLVYARVGDAAPPARRATWMGIVVSGLLLALSIGTPIGALIGAAFGWKTVFALLALLSLVLAPANLLVWPEIRAAASAGAAGRSPGITVLVRRLAPTILWSTSLYGFYTYLGAGLTEIGFSTAQIARAVACYGVGALAGTLLGGRAGDQFGSRATIAASLLGLSASLFATIYALGDELATDFLLAVVSLMAQLFFPAQQASLARDFPVWRATVLAWNNSALFLGISLGSLIGGETVARAGFSTDAGVSALLTLGGLGVAMMVVPLRPLAPS